MYQEFFQLAERPFKTDPFAKHYFPSKDCEQALQLCRLAILESTGPVLLIGATGLGKSMILAVLTEQFGNQFSVVNLATTSIQTPADLLQNILFELDRPYRNMLEGEMRLALMEHLKRGEPSQGILLLCDEAHALPESVLQELKSILNFVRDGQSRIRLILAGDHPLEETLTLPALESLNQRIAARCYLHTMQPDECIEYIDQHLVRAGQSASHVFEPSALEAMVEISKGVPRLINQLCCHGMILAVAHGAQKVTRDFVSQAWTDIQQMPTPWSNTESKASNLKDWAVVEFGELDEVDSSKNDEPNKHMNAQIESSEASSDEISFNDSNSIACDDPCLDPGTQEEPATAENETNIEANNESNVGTTSADAAWAGDTAFSTTFSTVTTTPSLSLPKHVPAENIPHDQISLEPNVQIEPKCEDVFGGGFDEEEMVDDQFTRWSAEQNRSSIDVSDDELKGLFDHADGIRHELESQNLQATPGPEIVIESTNTMEAEPYRPSEDTRELEELYNLFDNQEKLAEEVGKAAKPLDPRDQPLEADDTRTLEIENLATDYPIVEHTSYRDQSENDSIPISGQSNDDRDMLLVSQVNHRPNSASPEQDAQTGETTSQGQAARTDYHALFQRLRGDGSSSPVV